MLLEQRQAGEPTCSFRCSRWWSLADTLIFILPSVTRISGPTQNIGHTRDDAAGEAFDKVAKLLALGYPGGPIIDRLAPHGDARAVKFQMAQIKHRDRNERAKPATASEDSRPHFDFSYSGIKTAVLRYVETERLMPSIEKRRQALAEQMQNNRSQPTLEDYLQLCDRQTLNLVASFQRTMVNDLVTKTLAAAREYDAGTLLVSGGVSANQELRTTFQREAEMQGLPVFFPPVSFPPITPP